MCLWARYSTRLGARRTQWFTKSACARNNREWNRERFTVSLFGYTYIHLNLPHTYGVAPSWFDVGAYDHPRELSHQSRCLARPLRRNSTAYILTYNSWLFSSGGPYQTLSSGFTENHSIFIFANRASPSLLVLLLFMDTDTQLLVGALVVRETSSSMQEFKLYHYNPTIGGAVAFVLLFLGTTGFHTYQSFQTRC